MKVDVSEGTLKPKNVKNWNSFVLDADPGLPVPAILSLEAATFGLPVIGGHCADRFAINLCQNLQEMCNQILQYYCIVSE